MVPPAMPVSRAMDEAGIQMPDANIKEASPTPEMKPTFAQD